MRTTRIAAVFLGVVAVMSGAGIGYAAEKSDLGKREFTANCAVCHGQ